MELMVVVKHGGLLWKFVTIKYSGGTIMLEPRKRTALDGKSWWCVFDTETMKWSTILCFGNYKRKKDCQFAIDRYNHLYVDGRN